MKIVAISDLHGYLPEIPKCDLLIIAGDITPAYAVGLFDTYKWFNNTFNGWLAEAPAKDVVYCAGNHDFLFSPEYANRTAEELKPLRGHYLQDTAVNIDGLNIYGTPWTPTYGNWAFMRDEDSLDVIFSKIPDSLGILITHGPPFGLGDKVRTCVWSTSNLKSAGSTALLKHVERARPKIHVFGHLHENYGMWNLNNSKLYNVSLLDDYYNPINPPTVIEL